MLLRRFRFWVGRMFLLPEEHVPVRFTCSVCEVVYEAWARYEEQHMLLARLEHAHIMSAHYEDDDPDGGDEVDEEGLVIPFPQAVGE